MSELRGLSNRINNAALASKCRGSLSVVYLVINGTPELHTAPMCKAQRLPWKKVQKYCNGQSWERTRGYTESFTHKSQLNLWTQGSCGCLHDSITKSSQSTFQSGEERSPVLSLRGGVVDSCWLLGEGESALLKGVTPGRLTLPSGRAHTHDSMR